MAMPMRRRRPGRRMGLNNGGGGAGRAVAFVNGLPVVNNLAFARQFAVTTQIVEVISQSLYDSAAYPAAGVAQLTFFQQAAGGGVGVISGAAKGYEDTNMISAPLSAGMAYIITTLEIDFQPDIPFVVAQLPAVFGAQAAASLVNDAWKFRATGFFQLNMLQKPYMTEGPLMKFPASNDFEVDGAAADVSTPGAAMQTRIAYGRAMGPPYVLSPNNILIAPTMAFNATLNWSTLATIANPARVFVRFMGQLLRVAQ